jgi:outer membrane protein TolC
MAMSVQTPGMTADLPKDQPVTLKDCIEYALEHHNDVLSAESGLAGSRADVTVARSGFVPQITAGYDFSHTGTQGRPTSPFTFSGSQTSLGVTQTFWDGGRTQTAIRQAKASLTASSADLDVVRSNRVLTVTTAYFDVLLAQRLAGIAAQTVAESEEQRKLIQARIDTEDAAKIDIYPIEVQLANAQVTKLQADNNVRIFMSILTNAIGLVGNSQLQLVDVEEPSDVKPVTFDQSLSEALRSRPEIIRSRAQVDSANASLSLAKVQTGPVPSAGASYNKGFGGNDTSSEWVVGVGISLNVFNGSSAARVASARANVESATFGADQIENDISTEVQEANLNVTNSLERLAASKPNVTLARTNLEVARTKYQTGLGIPLEIVIAQTAYSDAQALNAQALYDFYVASAQLDRATGKKGYQIHD